jgi:hypothetical protein
MYDVHAEALPMKSFLKTIPFLTVLSCLGTPAQAHWGHVGELAGHAHLLGVGALAAAAALAAALLLPENEEEADEEMDAEAEGEAA